MYNPSFRYRGVSKPAGYFPRVAPVTSFSTQAVQNPYSPYKIPREGQPARCKFVFITGTLASYNGFGFTIMSPGYAPVRYQFYTGAAPVSPIVGIHLTTATAVGVATDFLNTMKAQSPPPFVGPYRTDYLAAGGGWIVSASAQPRVGLTQPFNGSYGNQLLQVDSDLDNVVSINGVQLFGAGDFSPMFFDGMGYEVPLLWGEQRALGPSSLPTPQFVPNPED